MFNALKLGCVSLLVVCVISGCAPGGCGRFNGPGRSALRFDRSGFVADRPWVKDEIRMFLSQAEVRSALGFDPLRYEQPILIRILEHRLSQHRGLAVFGVTVNEEISVSGHVFDPPPVLPASVRVPNGRPFYRKRCDMLGALGKDPQMLRLYRNLLVAHEVAHVAEWYFLARSGRCLKLTGHGVTDRVEVRILTNLYRSGKIDPETFLRMFRFYRTYLNEDHQPAEQIDTFLVHHLIFPLIGRQRSPLPETVPISRQALQ